MELVIVPDAISASMDSQLYKLLQWDGAVMFSCGRKNIAPMMGRGEPIGSVWAHSPEEALKHFQEIYPHAWASTGAV